MIRALAIGITTLALAISPYKNIKVPEKVQEITEYVGGIYNVSPYLLQSIAFNESSFRSYAENGSCKGIMQTSIIWHKDRYEKFGYTVDDWDFDYANILVATDYIAELANLDSDEPEPIELVLMRYHGESDAYEKYENGVVSGYAKRVLELAEFLEGKDGRNERTNCEN